jgi:hypothetical protein
MPKTATIDASLAKRYPRTVKAGADRQVELRLMDRGDVARMVGFARSLPPDDLLFLRRNITNTSAVEGWVDNIESGQAVVVLAFEGAELAGYASITSTSPTGCVTSAKSAC